MNKTPIDGWGFDVGCRVLHPMPRDVANSFFIP